MFVGVELVVVVAAVVDVVLAGALDVLVGLPVYTVPTTRYELASLFHVANTSGSLGRTLKRPAPESQQPFVWSQQNELSAFVTLEQDIRSVPPVSAPISHRHLVSCGL